ncbi:hypothetical protein CYLTODRAFT_68855 [Cylindrobasidium torrendii FP15055 ss-10]|uniref:F-box domain-containing protein n=1 Tax=Cylindrobasidium torrendii FP15055 ss-10 TaxID=1314674 RepID=A0A0D7B3S0_9AGAR|nr:hypothetical protein CYLTODRAFT_68855 [Cylindrobasidium torrendii FP15055 ss-10]
MHKPADSAPFPTHELPQHVLQDQDAFEDDPKFHHLIFTNAAPTEPEEKAILSKVADLEKRKAAIEIESARLQALPDSDGARLEQEVNISQERIFSAISSLKRVLSPVRRLPTEILQSIFLLTLDPDSIPEISLDEEAERWEFTAPEYTLPSLELVCREWRKAALDFPLLWSTICTELPVLDNTEADNSRIIAGLSLHLDRSKSALCPSLCITHRTAMRLPA